MLASAFRSTCGGDNGGSRLVIFALGNPHLLETTALKETRANSPRMAWAPKCKQEADGIGSGRFEWLGLRNATRGLMALAPGGSNGLGSEMQTRG